MRYPENLQTQPVFRGTYCIIRFILYWKLYLLHLSKAKYSKVIRYKSHQIMHHLTGFAWLLFNMWQHSSTALPFSLVYSDAIFPLQVCAQFVHCGVINFRKLDFMFIKFQHNDKIKYDFCILMIYELDNKELIFNFFLFLKYYIHEEIIGKIFKIFFFLFSLCNESHTIGVNIYNYNRNLCYIVIRCYNY